MSLHFNRLVSMAIIGTLSSAILVGCDDKQETTTVTVPRDVFITGTDDGYTSSAISVVGNTAPFLAANTVLPTHSDVDIFTQGNYVYRVDRSNHDSISKYEASTLDGTSTPIWQFSTRLKDETTSNVHDIVFASQNKAYMLRYKQKTAWVIDPSATTEASFKKAELDLASYADADGFPEMDQGVVANGKLFIILQRLVNNIPSDAWVAVFDVATDKEIDTHGNTAHKGILLPIQDPENIQYNPTTGKVYVGAIGSYTTTDQSVSGLVEIDPTTYSVRTILNPSSPVTGSAAYKRIYKSVVISNTQGYFIDYAGWGDNSLYSFNPSTGLVAAAPVPEFAHKNLGAMAYSSASGLWVGNSTDHAIKIIDTSSNNIIATVNTVLNPAAIRFIEK